MSYVYVVFKYGEQDTQNLLFMKPLHNASYYFLLPDE